MFPFVPTELHKKHRSLNWKGATKQTKNLISVKISRTGEEKGLKLSVILPKSGPVPALRFLFNHRYNIDIVAIFPADKRCFCIRRKGVV